jgi:PAS domain S-box-containing protein
MVSVPPFELLYRHFGFGFWIHTGYCYTIMLLATILLVRSLVNAPGRYKGQALSLLVGIAAPWIGNVMYVFSIPPFSDFDMTPVVFTISGIAFSWGVFRHRLLDIVPVAYDLMLNNMQDAVFVFDGNQRVLDLNPAAVRLAGKMRKGDTLQEAIALIPGWEDMVAPLEQGGLRRQICLPQDGQERYYDLIGTPLRHADELFGYLVVLRDITDSRNTQLALAESEKQFKSMTENAPVIICTLDPDGVITYVNPEWQKVLGHSRAQVVGRHYSEFVLAHNAGDYERALRSVLKKKQVLSGLPLKLVHRDGSRRFFNASASPNLDAGGFVSDIICLLKDQTGERELQAQLFQSQKMEAIGTLAGGIAHDFNNLLMGIQANVSLVRLEAGKNPRCAERINTIERQIQTGASLTRQLLGYARKGKYRPTLLGLNQLIEETLTAFGRTRKQLFIHFEPFENLPRVLADRGQMELVLLNLLINASDAMPEGGTLTVKTGMASLAPAEIKSMDLEPGDHVHLEIADTGVGMDEKTRARIFEPFFTTKEMGRGTGLGLASVYGVVKNHKGEIRVSSKPGIGTTFHLFFKAAPEDCPAPVDVHPLHAGGGRILFVDDEPELLVSVSALLEHLGYQVVALDNGIDALRHLSENPHAFDLIILDMIMPGMGGRELYGHIRRLAPDMRVLLSSGFSGDTGISDVLFHDRSDLIRKPYTVEALSQKIRDILAQSQHPPATSCSEAR